MSDHKDEKSPWYAPEEDKKVEVARSFFQSILFSIGASFDFFKRLRKIMGLLLSVGSAILAGMIVALIFLLDLSILEKVGAVFIVLILVMFALIFSVLQIMQVLKVSGVLKSSMSPFKILSNLSKGYVLGKEVRRGTPAPELALRQFIHQVRSYATERSYQQAQAEIAQKNSEEPAIKKMGAFPPGVDHLKRRWNEVVDSLNEFEIFLANDPKAIIGKLVTKYPSKNMDVSEIFKDVADTFDSTWRKKGINIETAIVSPLKATTNEHLLRRLLVGPWRASAYFARRGTGVVFSAKTKEGRVAVSWDTDGLFIPEHFLEIAKDSSMDLNERIERGMIEVAPDPQNSNAFHALVSFVTWIDIANLSKVDYKFKNTSDGFIIEMYFN